LLSAANVAKLPELVSKLHGRDYHVVEGARRRTIMLLSRDDRLIWPLLSRKSSIANTDRPVRSPLWRIKTILCLKVAFSGVVPYHVKQRSRDG
jgi:hypothetical protein